MIVDASVVLRALGDDAAAETLIGHTLAAPDLMVAESLNAVWKIRRAGHAAPPDTVVFAFIDDVEIVPSRSIAGRAARLAATYDHPVYACLYLALAEVRDDVLATADRRLVERLPRNQRSRIRLI